MIECLLDGFRQADDPGGPGQIRVRVCVGFGVGFGAGITAGITAGTTATATATRFGGFQAREDREILAQFVQQQAQVAVRFVLPILHPRIVAALLLLLLLLQPRPRQQQRQWTMPRAIMASDRAPLGLLDIIGYWIWCVLCCVVLCCCFLLCRVTFGDRGEVVGSQLPSALVVPCSSKHC